MQPGVSTDAIHLPHSANSSGCSCSSRHQLWVAGLPSRLLRPLEVPHWCCDFVCLVVFASFCILLISRALYSTDILVVFEATPWEWIWWQAAVFSVLHKNLLWTYTVHFFIPISSAYFWSHQFRDKQRAHATSALCFFLFFWYFFNFDLWHATLHKRHCGQTLGGGNCRQKMLRKLL